MLALMLTSLRLERSSGPPRIRPSSDAATAMRYLVNFDLTDGNRDSFWSALEHLGAKRILASASVVYRTGTNAAELTGFLLKALRDSDRLLVVEVPGPATLHRVGEPWEEL